MRQLGAALLFFLLPLTLMAVEDVAGVVNGTVKKVDSTTKTIVVRTADGVEHTFHFVGRTAVHGVHKTGEASKDALHGVEEGTEVAVHYTTKGTEKTAEEVDNIGKDGLKATEGTVTRMGSGGKTIVVKTADGSEETYHFASRAASTAGKSIAKGTEKSAKVTVYYTEEAGHKVAHFFKKT
ncbi:MAG TPA: hypothetical protein VMT32_12970 [Bryobacteraceae bacterium]|nr:hypothetical protein [Bryobacteraceae bacterium]